MSKGKQLNGQIEATRTSSPARRSCESSRRWRGEARSPQRLHWGGHFVKRTRTKTATTLTTSSNGFSRGRLTRCRVAASADEVLLSRRVSEEAAFFDRNYEKESRAPDGTICPAVQSAAVSDDLYHLRQKLDELVGK